jgi:hypothetical protein
MERKNHIEYVTGHDFFTENTVIIVNLSQGTCQSMLSRNRVLPYHWKGMNELEKQRILDEQ